MRFDTYSKIMVTIEKIRKICNYNIVISLFTLFVMMIRFRNIIPNIITLISFVWVVISVVVYMIVEIVNWFMDYLDS